MSRARAPRNATVTILGSAGSYPSVGRACSSYLVEYAGYRLLLDCGNGSLSNLQRVVDVAEIDAVIISHLHPDHFADIYGLYVALLLHQRGPLSVPVYAPAGSAETLATLMPAEPFTKHCRFHVITAGDSLDLGPVLVTFFAADHPIETLAARVTAGSTVIAYTADTGPSEEIRSAARGADLLLSEASWLAADGPHPSGLHLTGTDAGRLAAQAVVKRLVLTHVRAGIDLSTLVAEAEKTFDGPITVAEDLQVHSL